MSDQGDRDKLDMRIFGVVLGILFSGSCMAQISTMGTTELGIPSTPGAIVSSPLGGPSPFTSLFSAATVPGAPATTLASPPLATDPTIPGTSVTCSPTAVALSPSVMSVTATSTSAVAGSTAAMSSVGASAVMGTIGATTMPMSNTLPVTSSTTQPLLLPPAMPVMIVGSVSGSTTGTVATAPPLGYPQQGSSCTSSPGNALTSSAALPLAIGDIPAAPPPGVIQSPVADLGSTGIEPVMTVIPTPNSAACNESVSMDIANPAMMAPANATGATATPGVMPQGC
jgi:hypothetical protein